MSTDIQIAANRANAIASTGPKSEAGKTRIARNAVTLGLFTMNDFVLPEEAAGHALFCTRFWSDLQPSGPVQETFATEMIRAAWRLRRCGIVEADLAETPEQNEASMRIQNSVDRARAQANNIFRRAHTELRRLQSATAAQIGFELSDAEQVPSSTQNTPANRPQMTPRSAPCPCGSHEKYKRCCGRNAPPHLQAGRAS